MQTLPYHLLWIPFLIIFLPSFLSAVMMDNTKEEAPKLRGIFWGTFWLVSISIRGLLAYIVPRVSDYRLDIIPSTEWHLLMELKTVFDDKPILLLVVVVLTFLGGQLLMAVRMTKVRLGWNQSQLRAISYIYATFWAILSIMVLTACGRTL